MTTQPAAHVEAALHPLPAETIATWPVGTFLENILPLPDGRFVVSVHNERELHMVDADGTHRVWARLPASPAGLIAARNRVLVVAGEPGTSPHSLFGVDPDGQVETYLDVPDTLFLNGFTPGFDSRAYAVDSILGAVIEIDIDARTSRTVLRNESLTKCSDEPMLPGANGLKRRGSVLYVTNTDRALVLRVPVGRDGALGGVETVARDLRADDLAIGDDGTLYLTNHIHNTLTRLRPDGERMAIAGPEEGMAGCTACVFGLHGGASRSLFVTTTGGIIMPLDGVVQEAKLVRLDVGATGTPVAFGDAS